MHCGKCVIDMVTNAEDGLKTTAAESGLTKCLGQEMQDTSEADATWVQADLAVLRHQALASTWASQ